MGGLRLATGIIMIVGLIAGGVECNSILDQAQTSVHEVYAVATAAAYFVFAYILARAIENIGKSIRYYQERRKRTPED